MYFDLNIIIPVYNEGENIAATFAEIENKIKTQNKISVIYDFDEDNTLPVVKDYVQQNNKNNISLIKNKYHRGVLTAIKTGIESVGDGIILIVMADLSDDLAIVDKMFNKINEGYDIVCGSRYMKGGQQIGGPKFKKFLSRMAGVSLHYLTGIPTHDVTNSFKMYNKKIFESLEIESNGGFEIGMEIVVKSFINNYKITEVPSVWTDRVAGEAKFKLWKWLPKYIKWYKFAVINKLIKMENY